MAAEEPDSPEAESPYQSPRTASDGLTEPKETEKTPLLITRSPLKWFWECMALGLLLSVGPQYENVIGLFQGSWILLISIVPAAFFGVITGLGLALLLNHANREKFAELQPGHWRLIVAMLGMVRYLLSVFVFDTSSFDGQGMELDKVRNIEYLMYTPQAIAFALSTVFYVLVLRSTKEPSIWQWYAWVSLLVCFVTATVRGLLATPLLDSYASPDAMLSLESGFLIGPGLIIAYGSYAIGLMMVIGVIYDISKNIPRDVTHYLGIVLVAIQPSVQQWVDFIAYQYFNSPLS